MKRQEDSFEDIAFELEKQTYKSKFLPVMVVAIVVFQIVWKTRKLKQNNSLKVLSFLQKKAVPFFGQLKRQSSFP